MKKIIVFMMLAVLAATLLTGCAESGGNDFVKKSYASKDAELSGVNIDVRDREIEVSLSEDDQVHIDYFENDKESYSISVSDDQTLHMTAVDQKEWTDYIGKKADAENRKIYLRLPNAMVSTLSLATTNENIALSALAVTNSISISANGGNIAFEQIDAGAELILKAKNGNISGTVVGGYDDYAIACDIKKGESNLPSKKEGGGKTLTASGNNGNIDIQFVRS